MQEFEGKLETAGGPGAWTTITLPRRVASMLGPGSSVAVRGTIAGHPFRSNAMPRGDGTSYLVVSKAMRSAAGVAAGDRVTVALERDDRPRELELDTTFAAALRRSRRATTGWEALPPSARKQYASWIADAKTDATRERRIAKSIELIGEGKRLRG